MKIKLAFYTFIIASIYLINSCKEPTVIQADEFLSAIYGTIHPQFVTYENEKIASIQLFEAGALINADIKWTCEINTDIIDQDNEAMELTADFILQEGVVKSSGVALTFDFQEWNQANYVMIPASIYNGNRCKIVKRGYATGLDEKYLYKKDIPMMSNPLPQLSSNPDTISKIDINTCNAATPAMCFFNPKTKRAFILLAEQGVRFNGKMIDNGLRIQESPDRKSAQFVVSAPGVREKRPLFIGFDNSPDRGVDFLQGDTVTMKLRLYSFKTDNIPGLLEKFMTVRKEMTGQNQPRELIPFSKVKELMTKCIDSRWYDGPENQFYCPENANWISFGWIGGLMNTFPMLALGDEMHQERVLKTFDFAIPHAQGKSGYFYGCLNYDGKLFGREAYDGTPEIVLTRKNGDVLFWMIKQFKLLKAQGKDNVIKPEWEHNIQRLADAFVKTWKDCKTWGRMLDNSSGEVAEYNTSGGVMAIGGLALASKYYNNSEYLEIAEAAADYYYQTDFVKTGQTTGGCGDILHNADSETAGGFMTALMALYEITSNDTYLEMSRNLANLLATWTTSYDYVLPEETELAKNGAKLTGIVWASTQNKHGAPGLCTSSGDPLFKIYRATGDERYAELMHDIVRCHAESIRPDGHTNERLTYCDAETYSVGNRGNHVTGWNELNGALMALEIPGIYLQTNKDVIYVFDHVKARVLNRDNDGVTLEITNPTAYDAEVTIFAESAEESKKILGYTSFLDWPKVIVTSGKSITVNVYQDGSAYSVKYAKKEAAEFIKKLERKQTITIVTLGTSLTGGTWRWVDVFADWIHKVYPNQVSINNLGVGASASQTVPAMEGNEYIWKKCGLDRIQEAIALKPDVIFIEFAINDAYVPYGITLEMSENNLKSMINQIRKTLPDCEIILQSMNSIKNIPINDMFEADKRPDLEQYIDMYRRVAFEYQLLHINHYPNWKSLMDENPQEFLKYVTDGIHPTEAGYEKYMLPLLIEIIQEKK